MCKLAYIRTTNSNAYKACIEMIRHQENVCAGQSTGFVYRDTEGGWLQGGFHIRKAIGKVNSFLAKYPDFPMSNECLGHSRFASVGEINLENQHPIPVIMHGKTIAYGVHNGTFGDYVRYEHLRSDLQNKTDSALLMTMYGKMLEKIGDTPDNRRRTFRYIMSLIKVSSTHNLIIMFRDGTVLFSGDILTYKVMPERIGIMTFGLSEKCDDSQVYEIRGMKVYPYTPRMPPFRFKTREPKRLPSPKYMSCGTSCGISSGYFDYSGTHGRYIPEHTTGWKEAFNRKKHKKNHNAKLSRWGM